MQSTNTSLTPEQIAAQALIDAAADWAADPAAVGENDRDARNWLRDRAAALTNPQPVLPTEPGRYVDCDGDDDWLLHEDGRWFRGGIVVFGTRMHAVAPFTRLAPKRAPVTIDQINAALDLGEEAILALVNGGPR